MKKRLIFAACAFVGSAGVMATACAGDRPADATDAGSDVQVDVAHDRFDSANIIPPLSDASKKSCTLDNNDDPVLLCTQKMVLKAAHDAAFVSTTGALQSWDATTFAPDKDGTGAFAHDVHDDVAYAMACSTYAASATRYGDTELTYTLDLDLVTLAPLIRAELATLPDEYTGEMYQGLRGAAVGLRVLNRNDDATAFDALADRVGAAIFAHFITLSASSLDAGAGDGGGTGDAGGDAGDAGTLPQGDGVLANDAARKDYAPHLVASGALAMIDMAVRHTADDPTNAARYVSAAQQSLDHLYLRGRDPTTHLYYRLLVPSAASGADDLSPRASVPADLLATETTAGVALSLFLANDLVAANLKNGGPVTLLASYPFVARGSEAIAALNGTKSLHDVDKEGYFEGYVPSTGTVLTNKTTRANSLVFRAIHRANVVGISPYGAQLKPLRIVLGTRSPLGVGILSASGSQNAFYASVAKDYSVPPASYTIGDAGDVGPFVPHPNSYTTAAVTDAVQAFEEDWNGYP